MTRNSRNTKNKTVKIRAAKITHFPIDISKDFCKKLIENPNLGEGLYNKKLTVKRPSKDEEVNVTWDFEKLRQGILDKISKRLYGWYHESTSSAGNSTYYAIEALSKIRLTPNYLNTDKKYTGNRELKLHSKKLGTSTFDLNCPFFTAPYGCASEYGGNSNEINTMLGTIKAGGIYTFAQLTEYSLEYLVNIYKHHTTEANPFYMFQIYLTGDNDINTSLIERAKTCGVSVIMVTIDTGSNNHGGIGLLEYQSDLTYQRNFCGNLFHDPVFNIKCYNEHGCVGIKDGEILTPVSDYLKVPVDKLIASYDFTKSFDYAKMLQGKGMGNVNVSDDSKHHDLSIKHIADICHSSKPLCKFVKRKINLGTPLVIKGCLNPLNALALQKADVDGIYVSNHGGRFIYNSVAPINVLNEIRTVVKKTNKDFGVWFDGGIRNGQDILTAYAKGAEFVGIGRPIIYACVLYGESGVSSITKKLAFELGGQCHICGQNDLNDYDKLKKTVERLKNNP